MSPFFESTLWDVISWSMVANIFINSTCNVTRRMSVRGSHRRYVMASVQRITYPIVVVTWPLYGLSAVVDGDHWLLLIDIPLWAIAVWDYKNFLKDDDDNWWNQTKKKIKKKVKSWSTRALPLPSPA